VEHDPVTREPVLFEMKHRADRDEQARLAWQLGPLDLLVGKPAPMRWVFDTMSYSSIALFLVLLLTGGPFLWSLLDRGILALVVGFFVLMGLFAAVVLPNGTHYRSYLTPTLVVNQYGLLGRGRKVIPLAAIESVEADRSRYGSYGESVMLGDLKILDRGGSTFIYHVFESETAAQTIMDVKNGRPVTTPIAGGR